MPRYPHKGEGRHLTLFTCLGIDKDESEKKEWNERNNKRKNRPSIIYPNECISLKLLCTEKRETDGFRIGGKKLFL